MIELASKTYEPVKVVIFCPPSFKNEVKSYVMSVNGTSIQEVDGQTFYTPTENARPTAGSVGQVSQEAESKVMAIVDPRLVGDLRRIVEQAHPYESFAFEVYAVNENESSFYSDMLKLRVKTDQPQLAMKVLSDLGAARIGEYEGCFFMYKDQAGQGDVWVETVCSAEFVDEGAISEGSLSLKGFTVKIERLLDNPVAYGRQSKE